ncbi:MAG TPA: GNAT family N-acetyltransferase, partial [Patescibacteria group bacterium]|nr:GNAT family N-acetyltransferase [Patescibacteria group bacterium]
MKGIDIRELNASMTAQMAELLMKRQQREIESFKDLLNDKLDIKKIVSKLDEYFANDKIVGFGAFSGEKLVGYLFGQIKFDETRSKHAWVPYEGLAAEENVEELIWNLYAEASKCWLDWGCFSHYVSAPIGDQRYVGTLQRLSFAFDQVHAILDINKYTPFEASEDISVRLGNKEDADIIGGMSDIILSFQNASPGYTPISPDFVFRIRKGYKGLADDEDA